MALDVSTSVHNKTHLLSNLPASCCALGYSQKGKYHLGEYCKEAVRELIRYLRRDDADHTARRYLGKSKILVSDLLPIVKHYHEDDELFDLILRLLVNLTNPVLLLYNEELPSDAAARHYYLQIISQLQAYKASFADESLWAVLANKLTSILKIDSSERTEEVGMIAERILILIRNILQVPADPAEERPDSDASVHDRVVWALSQSGVTDLILYISSVESEQAYCMHVLEIICLMLREQSGTELAESQAERSLAERTKDVEELMTSLENEKVTKYNKMKSAFNTRHTRFGGSFVVRNTKGIGDNDIIVHKPYKDTETVPHDIKKEKSKVRKNEMALKDDDGRRRSPFGIRLFLQKFCNEFLSGSYNNLMRYVKGCLMRRIAQPNDESFYLWAMKFFMEFNRAAKNEIKLVSETMNVSCFYWVITQLENCHGMLKSDKKKVLFWSRRTHHALRAYLELMRTLTSMEMSNDKSVKESARVLQGNLFYVVEHREALLWLLNSFDESKMSRAYLQDLIETLHVFTKLLERFCKSQRGIVVQARHVKRKKKSKKSTPAARKAAVENTVSNEELWNDVAPEVSVVLTSGVIPDDIVPFDAASDRDIEDQKVDAMRRIHTLLKHRQYEEAVGLLRASREVWLENDIFGRANSNPEDELSTLREVFFAEIAQDPEVAANVENARNEEENRGEEDETDEENEEEEGVPNYSEKQYDFNDFLKRLVCSQAIMPACLLLKTFDTNPKFINHCVAKLLHRIAWESKSYAVLFQASLFIQFRKIMASPRPEHQELAKLAKFVFGKFVEVAQKNKLAFVELLPWKSAKQAFAVEGGYDDMNKESSASRKAWKEEEEDELRRLHSEYMRDEPGEDMIDWILERLINRDRTKLSVKKKLRELFLIQAPGQSKPPKDWTEAEICELTQLFGRYKDSNDPLDNILTNLTVKRGKTKVIDKLLDLGLVSDRKKLYKKSRSKSNVRRGGNNSSDDSDPGTNANRQKKTKKKNAEQKDRAALKKAQRKGPASKGQVVATLFQVLEADMRGGLQWLLESLKEAADDLEQEGDANVAEGIPLLAVEEDAVAAMDDPLFHRLLQNLGISPPFDEQEVYWRIPEDLSAALIREKVALLESVLDGTLTKDNIEDEVQSDGDSSGRDSETSHSSQKQKKPQKASGRRPRLSASSSEEDLVLPSERRQALGERNEPESQPANTPQSQRPKKTRRPHLSDSSSDDDLILTSERQPNSRSDDEPSSKLSVNTSQSHKKKSKNRRPHLSDSSSDDEVSLSALRPTSDHNDGPSCQKSAATPQSQRKKKDKNKRPHLSDTSSDEDLSLISERRPSQEDGDEVRSQESTNTPQSQQKKSKNRRPHLSDSSSDDEVSLSALRPTSDHNDGPSSQKSAATPQSQRKKKDQNKRLHLSDTSSDEDLSLISERRPTQEDGDEVRSQESTNTLQSQQKKSKNRRPRLSDSSSDDDVLSNTRASPMIKSTHKSQPASDSDLQTGKKSDEKIAKKGNIMFGGQEKKNTRKRIDKSLLESDSENERVPSPADSVGVDENDINSGNVLTTRKSTALDSDSDGSQQTQIQSKKKKAVLSDSEDEVAVQEKMSVVSSDEDMNQSEKKTNEKTSGKRVLSSSDEEPSISKKRAVEL